MQASNKQELNWKNILIKKNLIIKFEIPPADHLTKKFILYQQISSYKKSKFTTIRSWVDNDDGL